MHIQDTRWSAASALTTGGGAMGTATGGRGDESRAARTTPLRVDAQRNLEHVLRAAREVFGELGYGAPMEDVARARGWASARCTGGSRARTCWCGG